VAAATTAVATTATDKRLILAITAACGVMEVDLGSTK
jgi:hypothetical protein